MVIGTNSYIVNTTVDDTQIGQIAEGDQVDISLSGSGSSSGGATALGAGGGGGAGGSTTAASGSSTVYGTVGSISLIGSQSSDVTTFPVVIDVTGTPAVSMPAPAPT